MNFYENPWQGSFIVDDLVVLVEEAVHQEFAADRGGYVPRESGALR